MESGKVDVDDLAPWLKELRAEQRELNEKRDEALDDMNQADQAPFDAIQMEHYVQDLRSLLHSASFLESKTFLGTFIRRIDFDKEQVGIEYTIPISQSTTNPEVLAGGGPGCNERGRSHLLTDLVRQTNELAPNGLMTGPSLDR